MHSFANFPLWRISASAVALAASAASFPARAAEAASAPAPAPQQADQTTSVGTGATDSNADIVVTARHRNESSQGVPVAISVVGGDHIDSTGAFNVGRLQQLTPTLQFYSSNPRNTSVNVRSFGSRPTRSGWWLETSAIRAPSGGR